MTAADLRGVVWRKSSRSGSDTNCVELAELSTGVALRDSKDPTGPVLLVDRNTWTGFIDGVTSGSLDRH